MMLNVGQRKKLYALLARLFAYPDRQLLRRWEEESAVAAALLPQLPAPPTELRELEIAYTDAFINRLGGAPALPYGSVYLEPDGQLMGESSLQAGQAYRNEGLALEGSGEPPDYLPTELEFLYYLVEQEEQALGRRDVAAARHAGERQAAFCRDSLHPWAGEFCRRLAADADIHPLYRWGGELLESFCRMEKEWLEKMYPGPITADS
ncbi:MAG: molecular chaperone TorD family protein [Desulfuromonadales bacterium]|nr:molecular chaperone TorD family protein [Desulfuromonadales bacterium]